MSDNASGRLPLRTWCGYDGECWAGEPGHQRCDAHVLRDTYEAALVGLAKSNQHVFEARDEVERLRDGIRRHRHEMRARDAFWVDKAHRGTPGQSINEHLWALLDDQTETA